LPRRFDPRKDTGRVALTFFLFLAAAAPAWAVRPDEMLKDPVLEARAHKVGEELRCLVCRNQSIEDSEADLAHDLRVLVRQRIAAGDTDRQVIDYVHSRYGDFVLLKPPFQGDTALLWGGPLLLVLIGAGMAWRFYRTQPPPAPPLSDVEERRLAALLDDKAGP
jgi:cytochrome c-type biogenesis protein CcmH